LFQYVINLYCGQHKSSSYVNIFPLLQIDDGYKKQFIKEAKEIWSLKRNWQKSDETDPVFESPRLLWFSGNNLKILIDTLLEWESNADQKILTFTEERDSLLYEANYLRKCDTDEINQACNNMPVDILWLEGPSKYYEKRIGLLFEFISISIGWILGRWDIRKRTSRFSFSDDAFSSPPSYPPGTLFDKKGLPATPENIPSDYPLRISWHGILVNDEGHIEYIERRERETLQLIWQDHADAIEQEACQIFGVCSLREYFRKPTGFFAEHLK
jgi:hypothetical protein